MKMAFPMKRVLAILAALILLFACTAAADNSTIRHPRAISIVYDDSASMDDAIGITQYAMNVFLSMLDESDIVHLTMMSNPNLPFTLNMKAGKDVAIRQMNERVGYRGTPFQTVMTAMDKLKNTQITDPDSLYWLVIFTDGAFFDVSSPDSYLSQAMNTKMPNGTLPQICYICIGEYASRPNLKHNNLTIYPKGGQIVTKSHIFDTMHQMSEMISSRKAISSNAIKVSGNTMTFTTDFPSFSFAILNQGIEDRITAITGTDGKKLAAEVIDVAVPEGNPYENVVENAAMLESESLIINPPAGKSMLPAGTYTINLSSEAENVVVMTEPALTLDLTVTAAGTQDTSDDSLIIAGAADLQAQLHIYGESAPLNPASLPAGTTYSTRVVHGGAVIAEDRTSSMHLTNAQLRTGSIQFICEVTMPGVGTIRAGRTLDVPTLSNLYEPEAKNGVYTFPIDLFALPETGVTVRRAIAGKPVTLPQNVEYRVSSDLPLVCERQANDGYRIHSAGIDPLTFDAFGKHKVVVEYLRNGQKTDSETIVFDIKAPSVKTTFTPEKPGNRYSFSLREFADPTSAITITRFENNKQVQVHPECEYRINTDLPLVCERQTDGTFIIRNTSGLKPLEAYGDHSVTVDYVVRGEVRETYSLTIEVRKPVFAISKTSSPVTEIARTDIWLLNESAKAVADGRLGAEGVAKTPLMSCFTVSMDGTQMTAAEINNFGGMQLSISGELAKKYQVAGNLLDDGTLVTLPYAKSIDFISEKLWHWTDSWYRPMGRGETAVSIAGASEQAVWQVILEPIHVLLLNIGLPVLIAILLLGYVFKRRFPRGMTITIIPVSDNGSNHVSPCGEQEVYTLRSFSIRSLVPYMSAKATVRGMDIFPATKDTVMVRRSDLPSMCAMVSRDACTTRSAISVPCEGDILRTVNAADQTEDGSKNVPFSVSDVFFLTGDRRTGMFALLDTAKK